MDDCLSNSNNNSNITTDGVYCATSWDDVMCWPRTKANTTLTQPCAPIKGHDPKKFVTKFCSSNGKWITYNNDDSSLTDSSWTNYTDCFTEEVLKFLRKLIRGNREDLQKKIRVAENTRTLELVGLLASIISLVGSVIILRKFRILRNNRTKIHLNLFSAMLIQAIVRFIIYLDQAIVKHYTNEYGISLVSGIDTTPVLCESMYSILEYGKTVMFTWMFIEGLYLQINVSDLVFSSRFNYQTYVVLGWGLPILITCSWIIVMAYAAAGRVCWYGYGLMWPFWIMEVPRIVMLLVNFLFLLNIVRILVRKLKRDATPEIRQIRQAVRAAFFLMPLLGIPNMLFLIKAPIDSAVFVFALWSYSAYFFSSFQGVMVSVLYCFLHSEVRQLLVNRVRFYINFWYDRYTSSKRNAMRSMTSELSNNCE